MLKVLRRFFLGLVILLFVLLAGVAGVVAYAWTHPQETWAFIQDRFLPPDLKITFGDFGFSLRHLKGFDFALSLQIKELSVKKGEPAVDLRLQEVKLDTSVFPLTRHPWAQVHEVTLRATDAGSLTLPPSTDQGPAQNPFRQVRSILALVQRSRDWVVTENVHLDVQKFAFGIGAGEPFHLSGKIMQEARRGPQMDVSLNAERPGRTPVKASADGWVNLNSLESPQSFLEVRAAVTAGPVSVKQDLKMTAVGDLVTLHARGPVEFAQKKIHLFVDPRLVIELRPRAAKVNLEAGVRGIPGPLVEIKNLKAELQVPFEEGRQWSGEPATFQAGLPVGLFFIDQNMRRPFEKACHCVVPEVLRVEAAGELWIPTLLGEPPTAHKAISARLKVESVRNRLLSLDLAGQLVIEREKDQLRFLPAIDSLLVIHSYQGLRQFLDAKNILIPAPFQILEGEVRLKAKGPVGSAQNGTQIPVEVSCDLGSKDQKIKVNSVTQVRIDPQWKELFVDVSVHVADFQVELPPLDPLSGIPGVVPDSRIKKTEPKLAQKSAFQVHFSIDVETEQAGAIRLLSKLAKPFVPLSLSIQHNSQESAAGFLRIEPFAIEYLRRKVFIEKLRLGLDHVEQGVIPLEGRLRIDQTQYKVFLDLGGTTADPQVQLTSVPYLPREEIISVLLYDHTSDQSLSADNEAAGNFDAALADHAIGLFGLWAFATTPIRSFSYNTVTKVYSATVMLSDDLTAGIGTNWEQATQLELRKRVSKRWMLTASWNPTDDNTEGGKLVLQWEKRF